MVNMFDEYFKLLQDIYDYFDFKEDWSVYPLDDRRKYNWMIKGDEVYFGEIQDIVEDTGNQYCDEIFGGRFYDKLIYRKDEYTMIIVDTHVDGNRFLAIYDNSKEIKDDNLS